MVAWATHGGRRAGAVTALAVGAADALVRGWVGTSLPPLSSINATVLLLLAGVVMGYVSRLAAEAQRQLQEAAQREAAARERDRLARGIHDSVLQVLALVQRRGAELGGEAAQLGRLAGEQEATLRALVAGDAPPGPAGTVDLRSVLNQYAATSVTIAAPAVPVPVLAPVATDGRLGVAQSIQGRMRDLGGAATITSSPGLGTEVELRLPLGTSSGEG